MTIQRTASEREESTRQRRSTDTAAATRDSHRPDDDRDAVRSRDTETSRRDASASAVDDESPSTDPRPASRAARLQQARGNRAVARAAAAARDRLGDESREGDGSLEDASGGTPPETSTAAAGRVAPPEPMETGSPLPDVAAPRDVERDTRTDQPSEHRPATGSGTPAVTPAPSRRGRSPTRALGGTGGLAVQPKLDIGQSNDAYEREADAVAEAVVAGRSAPAVSTPGAGRRSGDAPDRTAGGGAERVQTQTDDAGGDPSRGPSSGADSIGRPGSGRPLPEGVRSRIEPALGTSLENVQLHTGTTAARATGSIGARALTHRNHVYLGDGESPQNVRLLAHEATHVVQQGAASHESRATPSSVPEVQPFLGESALEKLKDYTEYIPGWTLLTVLVGYNPLLGERVEPTPQNFLEALVGLIPGAKLVLDALRQFEVVEKAAQVLGEAVTESNLTVERIKQTLENAWNSLDTLDLIVSMGSSAEKVIEEHFVPLKNDAITFARTLVDRLVGVIEEAAIGVAERLFPDTAAWNLLTKLMEKDPLRGEAVEPTPAGILEDALLLIGAEQHLAKMREEGTFEETAAWLGEQIGRFKGLLSEVEGLVETAWEALSPENLPNLWSNLVRLASDVGEFLVNVTEFAWDVAAEVLARIKDALLGRLDAFARENVPGFDLLTVIAGQNPFTGEEVARTAERLIQGFITLLPNGRAIYQELSETGIVAEAGARIDEAVGRLEITWEYLRGLFVDLWESFSIEAIAEPAAAFQRIVTTLQEPVARLLDFVTVVLREVFRVALKAMNFPSDLLGSIISNVMGAIEAVRSDPLGFLTNMLEAVRLGFQNFFDNILTHLVGGLTDWLFRGLREAGIEPPADFSLGSVLEFVMGVIGVTTDRLWEKLADRIGEENVQRIREAIDVVTGVWEFVRDVQRRGIVAIWEYVTSQLRGLWDSVLDLAREWIMEQVVYRAMKWLAGLLDPSGITAVINSFQAFFNALQSAAEYVRDILAIVNDYVSTIAAVAQGQLEAGAQMLEQGLANSIPVAIGFLARQFGLENIGEKIQEIVQGVRETVDQAIEWLLDKAEAAVDTVLGMIGLGGEEEADETEADGEAPAGDGAAWWGLQTPVEVGDETHTLAFDGPGPAADLVVRSNEKPLTPWLRQIQQTLEDARGSMDEDEWNHNWDVIEEILKHAQNIQRLKKEQGSEREGRVWVPVEGKRIYYDPQIGQDIQRFYGAIAEQMKKLTVTDEAPSGRPPTVIEKSPARAPVTDETVGGEVTARPLSFDPGCYGGGGTGGGRLTSLFGRITSVRKGTYVQAHLLHHELHGPFEPWNIVPLPKGTNNSMRSAIEGPLLTAVMQENQVLSYAIRVQFGTHTGECLAPEERAVPTSLTARAVPMVLRSNVPQTNEAATDPNNWTADPTASPLVDVSIRVQMPSGPPEGIRFTRISLSETYSDEAHRTAAARTLAERVPGIGMGIAERIIEDKPATREDLESIDYIGEKRLRALSAVIEDMETLPGVESQQISDLVITLTGRSTTAASGE